MRDNTAKDEKHTLIKSALVQSFGVTCALMVDKETQQLSPQTLIDVTFIQKGGATITHELTIREFLDLEELFRKLLGELNEVAKTQGVKEP